MSIQEHLQLRHMNLAVHTTWLDEVEDVATFPLWNLSGKMIGYQIYRPSGAKKVFNHPKEGRYYTYRKNLDIGVWGLESWKFSNTLFITEGVFDACRLTERGYSAIAMAANAVDKSTGRWLWTVGKFRPVVAICDNDVAGLKLSKYATSHVIVEGEKDLGDSSDEYVINLLKGYT